DVKKSMWIRLRSSVIGIRQSWGGHRAADRHRMEPLGSVKDDDDAHQRQDLRAPVGGLQSRRDRGGAPLLRRRDRGLRPDLPDGSYRGREGVLLLLNQMLS